MNDEQSKDVTVVHEVLIDGNEYISTKLAQELTKLTPRHIMKLCRQNREDWRALHVGSNEAWFIRKEDVLNYEPRRIDRKST